MTTDASLSKQERMLRFLKEAEARVSIRYRWAMASCPVTILIIVGCLLSAPLHQSPWQAYGAVALVLSTIVFHLWRAYYLASREAEAWRQKLCE